MKALSDKGTELLKKFKRFQKISVALYALAAIAFVFADNIPLMIAIVVLEIFLETKLCRCPHCDKALDPRRKTNEDSVCPKCNKYIFRGL